ncbi:MAG: UUP1 family membrane protein, partial [Gammaproteobacteria bacterium]
MVNRVQERRNFLVLEGVLVVVGCLALFVHWQHAPLSLQQFLPATVYEIETRMSLDAYGEDVKLEVYLPETDERQTLINEHLDSGEFAFADTETVSGRLGRWSAEQLNGEHTLHYKATVANRSVRYEMAPDLVPALRVDPILEPYVRATDVIQVQHPEIRELWRQIAPAQRSTATILRAIFDYTRNELEPAEFKGVTDALTALRLRQASCNGKSRLFAALARLNNIPARLVGGVILMAGEKRTSHQWVEAWVEDRWIPFCPTNGYFAEIPKNYLTLYRNDEALFRHTSNINFDYRFDITERLAVSPELMDTHAVAANPVLELFRRLGLDTRTSGVFLLFPVAALVISFCRNVVGVASFGVFLPMLMGAACRFTGLLAGLIGFVLVMSVAALAHYALNRTRVLQIPKLAALITVVTGVIVIVSVTGARNFDPGLALLIMFPVVILSFAAERLH